MYVRDAQNSDEAWMLEKINQNGYDEASFRSRDFLIGTDEQSDQRVVFGRLRYHRSEDDEELVEITSFFPLDRASQDQACELVVELTDAARKANYDFAYAFLPSETVEYFSRVGFNEVTVESLPSVLQERMERKASHLDTPLTAMRIDTKQADYTSESEVDTSPGSVKPSGQDASEEEIEQLKDELDITDNNTKYST